MIALVKIEWPLPKPSRPVVILLSQCDLQSNKSMWSAMSTISRDLQTLKGHHKFIWVLDLDAWFGRLLGAYLLVIPCVTWYHAWHTRTRTAVCDDRCLVVHNFVNCLAGYVSANWRRQNWLIVTRNQPTNQLAKIQKYWWVLQLTLTHDGRAQNVILICDCASHLTYDGCDGVALLFGVLRGHECD